MTNTELDEAARVGRLAKVTGELPMTSTAELLDRLLSIGSHQVHGNVESSLLVGELGKRIDEGRKEA
jgi:hypothetical protein